MKKSGGVDELLAAVGRARREEAAEVARDDATVATYAEMLGKCFVGGAGPDGGAVRSWSASLLAELLPPAEPAAAALEGLGVPRAALAAGCEQELRVALAALARVGGDAHGLADLAALLGS